MGGKLHLMSAVKRHFVSSLFGTKLQIDVGRGIAEFHAGRPVLITDDGETLLALPVEGLDAQRLAEFMALCAPVVPRLVITARRALALGLEATTPVALQLAVGFDADTILALVADAKIGRPADATDSRPAGHCRYPSREIIARPACGARGRNRGARCATIRTTPRHRRG